MADDDLEIKLKLDRSQAKSEMTDQATDEQNMVDAKAAAEQKKEDAQRNSGKRRSKDAKETTTEILTDEQAKQAASVSLIEDGNRKKIAGFKRVMVDQKTLLNDVFTSEEAMTAAKNQKISAANSARVNEAVKILKREEFANASIFQNVKNLITPLNMVALGYKAISLAGSALTSIAAMWQAQREDLEKSVDRVVNYKEKLLELAALKDKLGNPDPVHAEILGFRAITGQTAEQADAFQKGSLNTGQVAIKGGLVSDTPGKNGEKSEWAKLNEMMGKYQAAVNADPKAIGELTGILPQMIGSKNQKSDDIFRRAIGIFGTLQMGGSDLGPAVRAFNSNMSLLGPGSVRTPEQLAALSSAYSVTSAGKEGTMVDQLVRSTNLAQLRQTKTGAENSITTSAYLKSIGVTDQKDAPQVGLAIAQDIAKEMKKLQGKTNPDGTPTELNIGQFLVSKGFEGPDMIDPVTLLAKSMNSGLFGDTFGKRMTAESAPTIAEARAATNDFDQSVVMGKRQLDVSGDIADASRVGQSDTHYKQIRELAFKNLYKDPNSGVYGEKEGYLNSVIWRGKIDDEVLRMETERAAKAGITVPGSTNTMNPVDSVSKFMGMGGSDSPLGGSFLSRLTTTNRQRADFYYDLDEQIKGVNKGNGVVNKALDNSELVKSIDRNSVATEEANRIEKAKLAPGMPTPQPASKVKDGARQNITR